MSLLSETYGSGSDDDGSDDGVAVGGLGLVAYGDDDAPDAPEGENADNTTAPPPSLGAEVRPTAAPSAPTAPDSADKGGSGSTDASDKEAKPAKGAGLRSSSMLPPRPAGQPESHLTKSVNLLLQKKREGMDMNRYIRSMRPFQNPSLYEKLIDMMGIDQIGSNCPKQVYDPNRWGEDDYFDRLAAARNAADAKRAEARRKRPEVQFVSASARNPPVPSAVVAGKSRRPAIDQQKLEAKRQEVARRAAAMLSAKGVS
mmetsp:Transcript_8621/g.22264  ORF Transcript_8621/g.22264 Transcript_8621/m.22264 type:complete len:257 (+) Transcript_8621:125-895(+)